MVTITAATAADDNTTTTTTTTVDATHNTDIVADESVQTTTKSSNINKEIKKSENKKVETKEVETKKSNNDNIKTEKKDNEYTVEDYAGLIEKFEEIKQQTTGDSATINIDGGYWGLEDGYELLNWTSSNSIKTLIINGNNNRISMDSKGIFMNVGDGFTVYLNNIRFKYGYTPKTVSVINNSNGHIYMENVTFSDCRTDGIEDTVLIYQTGDNATLTLTNVSMDNSCKGSIYALGGSVNLINSSFIDNKETDDTYAQGSRRYNMIIGENVTFTLTNTIISYEVKPYGDTTRVNLMSPVNYKKLTSNDNVTFIDNGVALTDPVAIDDGFVNTTHEFGESVADPHIIEINYPGLTGNATNSSIRLIIKASIDDYIQIPYTTTVEGVEVTTTVKLYDKHGNPITEDLPVEVFITDYNGHEYRLPSIVKDSQLSFTVTDNVDAGHYTGFVNTQATDIYSSHSFSAVVDVTPANVKITEISDDIKTASKLNATVRVQDDNQTLINGGYVIFKINGVTLKDENNKTIQSDVVDGIAKLTEYELKGRYNTGDYKLVAVYKNGNVSKEAKRSFTIERTDLDYYMELPEYTTKALTNTTIELNLTDEFGQQVYGKTKVSVKIGGKTVVEAAEVIDGKVNITVNTEKMKCNDYYMEVIIAGNNRYNERRLYTYLTIIIRDATIEISPINTTTKGNITANITVKDDDGKLVNGGFVIAKVNGKTLKDADGNTLKFNVVNGKAEINTAVAGGLKAQDYDLEVVYSNDKYFNRASEISKLSVVKTDIKDLDIPNVPINTNKGENTTIVTQVYDVYGNAIEGKTKIAVKINNKSVQFTPKEKYIMNGNLNITIDTSNMGAKEYTIEIILGENNYYNTKKSTVALNITEPTNVLESRI